MTAWRVRRGARNYNRKGLDDHQIAEPSPLVLDAIVKSVSPLYQCPGSSARSPLALPP